MHEHGLAKELWPQLKAIAERGGFVKITRVDMMVGALHAVSADFLAHSFEHAFEGTNFQDAAMNIVVVDPGEEYSAPGRSDTAKANGWELLISRIEGDKA